MFEHVVTDAHNDEFEEFLKPDIILYSNYTQLSSLKLTQPVYTFM